MAGAPRTRQSTVDLVEANARPVLQEKVKRAGEACARGEFQQAVELYTQAIEINPSNHVLYGNRSAACIKILDFEKALKDGEKAAELQPLWPKAHYRQGVALQCMGRHAEALAAFSTALAQDEKSPQLLNTLYDAAMKSPLKDSLIPICEQLKTMKLDRNPFVMISVIGQELLSIGHIAVAVGCLEAALKIGTCGLRLRGSVISALSTAFWKLGNLVKAEEYMKQDLETSQSLGDKAGECRAHGNLGGAYYAQRDLAKALEHHRQQLAIAMKLKDRRSAALALSSLGHVSVADCNYTDALGNHRQAAVMYKELGDRLAEARELGNVGAVHVLMSQPDDAIRCHQEHLEIAIDLRDKCEEGRAYSNLGSVYHYKRDYEKAIYFHKLVLDVAKKTEDYSMESRAYAGLGHAYRCKGDINEACAYHEKQLEVSVRSKDRPSEGRAFSNLGIILQQQGNYTQALKLHKSHLAICKETDDRAGQGRAYGNMGCAYSALGRYDQAIKFHKQELLISREVNDYGSEACTHGNLAVAYQATGSLDKALKHYQHHLSVSVNLKDKINESTALFNLGNFYSSCGEFNNAVPYYEKFLNLTKQLKDTMGECKGCQNLGFAYYSLGNYSEAVKYYERNITLAQDLDDRTSLARAHCNIGLAFSALGNYDRALDNQKLFLQVSNEVDDSEGVYKALGNIGDIYMNLQDARLGITNYKEQLRLAESMDNISFMGDAYGTLGNAYRTAGETGLALDCHQRELSIRKESHDTSGTYKAFGNLGSNYLVLGRYDDALGCYNEQLAIAKELRDGLLELQVYGNLGLCKMQSGDYEEALVCFEHQLSFLEERTEAFLEIARIHGNIGECHHLLGHHTEAIKYYTKYLLASQQADSTADQDNAYRGLGNAHRSMGSLQDALVCFEKRLVVAHDLTNITSKTATYGELGSLHKSLGNYEQAITCYKQQLVFARECGDVISEADALSGLGIVSQKIGEYDKALHYHEQEMVIVEQDCDVNRKALAYHHLGTSHEALGNYKQAVIYQEEHLRLAAQTGDQLAKSQAYVSLGRTYHAMSNFTQAISYLRQGLVIAENLKRPEDEARIRHRLGLSLLANKQLEVSYDELKQASELLESIRRDVVNSGEFKVSLYELQAACYQMLQRVLVDLGRHVEALAVAERARTRSFIDLLLERQAQSNIGVNINKSQLDNTFKTGKQIMDFVKQQKATVLYYSIAAGHLYSWLMVPQEGLVKFRDSLVVDGNKEETILDLEQSASAEYSHTGSLLDSYITQVRDALGVEPHSNRSIADNELDESIDQDSVLGISSVRSYLSADEDDDDMSITSTPGRPGSFSRHRNSRGKVGKMNGLRFSGHGRSSKPPLRALYELLIAPMEDVLPTSTTSEDGGSELILVLEGDLYLVPFSVLRGSLSKEPLFRRFRLIVVPSLDVLYKSQEKMRKQSQVKVDLSSTLVVGNPIVPATFGQWASNPSAEHEAKIVAELFKSKPLLGNNATKSVIMKQLPSSQCVHFATHVSWKLAALILSPTSSEKPSSPRINSDGLELLDDTDDSPALSDFLLTAADLLDLQLSSKLIVIGAAYDHSSKNRITSDGLIGLTRAFLVAGAQGILVALWPVPDLACKLLLKAFYGGVLKGFTASHALSQAMNVVQKTKQFSHPSNWAGFVLIGGDPVLTSKARMGSAFGLLLNNPKFYREAMKVLVHLVDKALQRIRHGQRSSMYTAEASIDAKVKGVNGWRELLSSVGFRFQRAKNSLPDSVFFPSASDATKERLTLASNHLHAFLGLSPATLQALAKLAYTNDVNLALITLLNDVLKCFFNNMANVQVPLKLKLWRTLGCHELLASLGFDLVGVGKEEVMLRSGKANSRRALQCTVQALCALTDTVNPLDSEEPNFALVAKSHSSSTVMSNLSFMSASLGSDLDMRTKSAEDLNFLNRERRQGSSGSNTSRQRRRSHRSSTEALMRSLADLEAESSVDPDVTPVNSQTTETIQQNNGGSSTSPPLVNRRSSQRSVSSIDISGLKVSSVDVPYQPPRQDNPASDTSDVDSYSDITSQHKGEAVISQEPTNKGKGLVLRKTHSSSSSASSIGKPDDSSSGSKTPGSISQLRTQHNEHNVKADRMAWRSTYGNMKTSTPNMYIEANKSPQKLMNHTPLKYRSEGNLTSYHNPVPSLPSNGLLTTLKDEVALTNGDVQRSKEPMLPNGNSSVSRPALRRLFGSQDKLKVSSVDNTTSEDERRTTDDELFYGKKSYASNLRNISGSNEYLHRTSAPRPNRVITAQNTYTDRSRKPILSNQGLSVHISTDSYSSSQDSSLDSPTHRQIAAEYAATALMQNRQSGRSGSSSSSLTRENLAMKDLRDKDISHTKLKQGHIANLAHLHSSSC